MPIVLTNGAFFGTLCAIDPRPARLNTPAVVGMFKNFAQLIAFHLDAQERAAKQNAALLDAREAADLREQFVAILAHDLRNPLASIDAGVNLLLRRKPDEKTLAVGEHMQNSVKRMASLIDDTLDFAKGRLGGGFLLERDPDAPLLDHLEQVIGEFRAVNEIPIENSNSFYALYQLRPEARRSDRLEPRGERAETWCGGSAHPYFGVDRRRRIRNHGGERRRSD